MNILGDPLLPRNITVSLTVAGGDATAITDDLISFEYDESISCRGGSMKIELADPNLKYLNDWTISKGTQVSATLSLNNWGNNALSQMSQSPPLDTGAMYIDEVKFHLK